MESIKFHVDNDSSCVLLFRHFFCSLTLFLSLPSRPSIASLSVLSFCAIHSLSFTSLSSFQRLLVTLAPFHRSCLFITSLSPLSTHSSAPCKCHSFSPSLSPLYYLLAAFDLPLPVITPSPFHYLSVTSFFTFSVSSSFFHPSISSL